MNSETVNPEADQSEPTVYILGYWGNPYRANDNEYYWMRCEEGKKTAKAWGESKQKRGQPSRFTNWCKGKNSYFTDVKKFYKAAKKAGLTPRLWDEEMAIVNA